MVRSTPFFFGLALNLLLGQFSMSRSCTQNQIRFLNPDGSAHEDLVLTTIFGLGGWICPGRQLAGAVYFIVIASLLSVFNTKKRHH